MMDIIIQKFGGTSVASKDAIDCVVKKIKEAMEQGFTSVVVVSAMGRKGQPYATDSLLSLVSGADVRQEMRQNVDLLLSCGEIIAAAVLSDSLNQAGLPAVVMTGQQAGIITDSNFNQAKIMDLKPDRIKEQLKLGRIVIVTGFQGSTTEGEITTLGRGGSDTTASALGVALDARMIEIYTDVEGIMTADPSIAKEAKILDMVSYSELYHLAYHGAKVIHPQAVKLAKSRQIPLKIRSTFSDHPGTLVMGSSSHHKRTITGIAYTNGIVQVRLNLKSKDEPGSQLSQMFSQLENIALRTDFIHISRREAVFTIQESDLISAREAWECLKLEAEVIPDCSRISLVGTDLSGESGIMARLILALAEEGIEILQTADSYTTIWCLIRSGDRDRAVRALHKIFQLG